MKYLKETMAELAEIEAQLDVFVQLGVDEGIAPDYVNPTNAAQRVEKRLKVLRSLEATAKELGYSTLPNALKALKMMTDKSAVTSLSQLPEVFHNVPHAWLYGKADTKRRPGFKPLSRPVAERKHRVITPLLIEAWQLTEGDQSIQSSIEREYLSTSADEFEKALYVYIHDLEPVSLEEEFENILPATEAETAESLRLATDPNRIYGVVKKEDMK